MLLPIKWLNDYCEFEVDSRTLSDGLTDSGSHVDSIIKRDKGISGIVAGKVLKIEKHPNADKLVVCKVDLGDKEETIVTGAPNVFEGAIVPIAKVGAKLPGGIEISPTDFRGIESFGMMCSLEELGFELSVIPKEFRDGIYIFDEETPVGEDAVKLLGLDWEVLDIEITPNRPDCLSIYGMARETKATFDKELISPDLTISKEEGDIKEYLKSITIESPNCIRYYSRVLKDVEIGPSPQWMQNNLMAAGVRPINNMVDITNYVMLEFGIPMHAFDYEDLRGGEIRVYQAKDGEEFVTLDDQVRKLTSEDMVIADGEGPIALAGIMGGLDSGVKDTTKTIVLEGANFNGPTVRHTSKRLGLRTEASARFEKGLDPELAKLAVERACHLAEQIGCAKVVGGSYDEYKVEKQAKLVKMRPDRCRKLLGVDLTTDQMLETFKRLDFGVSEYDDYITCEIPSFRGDINIEVDLIEEVGRFYGLNNIKPTEIYTTMTRGGKPYFKHVEKQIKDFLKGLGYNEILTYSFISPRTYDKLMIPEGDKRRDNVKILNPLGEEYSVMRTTLVGNILEVISRNQNRNVDEMLAYEIGNTFSPERDKDGIPTEGLKLVLAAYGQVDFYFVKESMEKLLANLGINNYSFERESDNSIYHPGRAAKMFIEGEYLGSFGEVNPLVMKNYEIKTRTIAGEFDFNLIEKYSTDKRQFKPLPKYPTSDRDLAILLDKDVMVSEIKNICLENGGELLESFKVFDIYTGDQIAENKKSIAFNLKFRSYERTLKDEEVDLAVKNIISALESQLKAELRD